MSATFEVYRPRQIEFEDWLIVDDWMVKLYTITNKESFGSFGILQNVKRHIPIWLKAIANSKLPTYKNAFAIVHEAREGVWILLSWWTGGEMVETKVYFSSFDLPDIITDSPYKTNSLLCVWELEVFAHERAAWIKDVLQNANKPDFEKYKRNVFAS